jgi:hypothetical protein
VFHDDALFAEDAIAIRFGPSLEGVVQRRVIQAIIGHLVEDGGDALGRPFDRFRLILSWLAFAQRIGLLREFSLHAVGGQRVHHVAHDRIVDAVDLPIWVPLAVQEQVVRILVRLRATVPSDEVDRSFTVLKGLATNECMKGVWSTLQYKNKDRRSTTEYVRQPIYSSEVASRLGIDPRDQARIQDAAMRVIFITAFELSTLPLLIRKRGNVPPRMLMCVPDVDRYADIEVDLEALAKEFQATPSALHKLLGETVMGVVVDGIRDGALGRWHVVLCRREVVLMVKRKVDDARARCVGIGIAAMCKDLFGSELYGTTANIAKAVTGKEINLAKVRQWCSEVERDAQGIGKKNDGVAKPFRADGAVD